MTHFTPEFLINAAKTYLRADSARMELRTEGTPRGAWRSENPITEPHSFLVRDNNFKTNPKRRLDIDSTPYDLAVWATGNSSKLIERIDLRAGDAAKKLSRYEIV